MKVLLVGGDRDGQIVEVADVRYEPRVGYKPPDYYGLPDPEARWAPPAVVPRVAVSFAEDSGFPTLSEVMALDPPRVPEDAHAALHAAWAKALAS